MSTGETAYLALVLGTFVTYMGLLAYGMVVASERPAAATQRPAEAPSRRLAA